MLRRLAKGNLIDIEVERVDGVTTPATRRKFLIAKSAAISDNPDPADAEEAAFTENVRSLANSSSALLKAIHDNPDQFPMTEDMAGLANDMAKSLGVEMEFKAFAPPAKKPTMAPPGDNDNDPEDAAEGPEDPNDNDPEDAAEAQQQKKPTGKDINADALSAAITAAMAPFVKALTDQSAEISKLTKTLADEPDPIAKSLGRPKQVRRQGVAKASDPEIEIGQGVFENVVFGAG